MVLSILFETTRPCFTRRELRSSTTSGLRCSMLSLRQALLGDNGLYLRVGPAHRPNLAEVGQVAGAQREAQVEKLRLRVAGLLLQLLHGEVAQDIEIVAFHAASSREMIFVLIGSFEAARCSASRAVVGATPESSKSTRPGRTTATHSSGLPLPEPMRTSAGFFVTGLSGNTLIQTFPPRLMWRVIA